MSALTAFVSGFAGGGLLVSVLWFWWAGLFSSVPGNVRPCRFARNGADLNAGRAGQGGDPS